MGCYSAVSRLSVQCAAYTAVTVCTCVVVSEEARSAGLSAAGYSVQKRIWYKEEDKEGNPAVLPSHVSL